MLLVLCPNCMEAYLVTVFNNGELYLWCLRCFSLWSVDKKKFNGEGEILLIFKGILKPDQTDMGSMPIN